jgi:2-(1,2-epoxy-1,2-dihydrophenyl)acetyl-CoA isomerase
MGYETLLLAIDDGVATITFNRPEHRNAVTAAMVSELYDAVRTVAADDELRVLVLTGAGDRFFNPGADLDASRQRGGTASGEPAPMLDPHYLHTSAILHDMPQVTLAAINGSCAGAGFGWALGCDLRVASSTAKFATAFLDVGVAGDMGVPWSLPRIVGATKARDLLFLRGKFDAAKALELGLVNEVFEPSEFRAGVDAVVARLRGVAPRALRTLKLNLVAAERMSFVDFLDLETQRHYPLVTGPEFGAGVDSFLATRSVPTAKS